MADEDDWEFPDSARPQAADLAYDLEDALAAVVSLRAEVPEDAFTAGVLGTERAGNGVVIDPSGLVLTIGYLVTEAETVWLVTGTGGATAAHVVAYDHETGFGLVQALGRLRSPALELGSAADSAVGDKVVLAGHGGHRHALAARLVAKHEFAGYWEYLLDEALFTAPPHPNWGGAALIGADGRLRGIGSLLVQGGSAGDQREFEGNMIVPIDLLPPILDDLLRYGKADRPARPWLGMYAVETDDRLVVVGLAEGAPAERAEVRPGDEVVAVAGRPVTDLASMLRRIRALGGAGVAVPLTLRRGGELSDITVQSADRRSFLKSARLH